MADSLLDVAVKEFKIPKWPYEAAYDRIVVFSLPEDKASRETFVPGGVVVKPEQFQAREEAETPRAVLVSAGLGARDILRSHGMGLGHVVWVARLSPWRHEVDRGADGKVIEFLFLRVGDVVGSETLQKSITDGNVQVSLKEDGTHCYYYLNDGAVPRFDPPSYVG